MTAALRVGATLEPTPLELARQALVDAVLAYEDANDALYADPVGERSLDNYLRVNVAYTALLEKTTAYRDALAESKP